MNIFKYRALAALSLLLGGIVPVLGDEGSKDGGGLPALSDVRVKMSSSSSGTKGERIEFREVVITADKPGFVHLWHYYGDEPLTAPLLPRAC